MLLPVGRDRGATGLRQLERVTGKRKDGKAAGCIALRKLSDSACELKRLYVRPEFRRKGIAAALVSRILSEARSIGYREIYLDTLPELEELHNHK